MVTEDLVKRAFAEDSFYLNSGFFKVEDLIQFYGLIEALRRLSQGKESIEPDYLEEILEKWFTLKGILL